MSPSSIGLVAELFGPKLTSQTLREREKERDYLKFKKSSINTADIKETQQRLYFVKMCKKQDFLSQYSISQLGIQNSEKLRGRASRKS